MAKQTTERDKLYAKVSHPDDHIPINIEPFTVNTVAPEEVEIRGVVRGMRNGRAGGASGIRAEHMKEWLRDAVLEKEKEAEDIEGFAGKGGRWRIFVKLMQIIWEKGEIPQQMRWMTVVLIP